MRVKLKTLEKILEEHPGYEKAGSGKVGEHTIYRIKNRMFIINLDSLHSIFGKHINVEYLYDYNRLKVYGIQEAAGYRIYGDYIEWGTEIDAIFKPLLESLCEQ